MSRAVLRGGQFTGADLTGANLVGSVLADATFAGAVWRGALISEDAWRPEMSGAKLVSVDETNLRAFSAVLSNATYERLRWELRPPVASLKQSHLIEINRGDGVRVTVRTLGSTPPAVRQFGTVQNPSIAAAVKEMAVDYAGWSFIDNSVEISPAFDPDLYDELCELWPSLINIRASAEA